MTQNPRPPLTPAHSPARLLATWFGTGNLPRAPGTWGSLTALPFAWGLQVWGGNTALAAAIALVFALGLWSTGGYLKDSADSDPGPVVIDEVVGQWIVLLAMPAPFHPDALGYAAGFALFRFFDIIKPWPISWADKNIKGAFGVMVDDVLAGLAGAAVLAAIVYGLGL